MRTSPNPTRARRIFDREEFESAETPVDAADPETRRRHVHERGRAAVEQMRAHGGAEE